MKVPSFADFGLADPIQRALKARKYQSPTPIQVRAIPELLAGRDLLGIAQTGTGKTAAFALPILQRLSENRRNTPRNCPRALVLAPTRELAIQIGEAFQAYGRDLPLRQAVIFGGVNQKPQVQALSQGVDIVIATPGRLLDLLGQGRLGLAAVECFVLDEADRMLDMGFVRDVRKIVAVLPEARQSLLFSATMPGEIGRLAGEMLRRPVRVEVAPQATPIERIAQSVYHVAAGDKTALLADLLADRALRRVIVFARTKHRANRVAQKLERLAIAAEAIHGNKSQNARQRALERFRAGRVRVLVATDIAARGIDVEGITHVINYELPNEPESYVHRIGRTARAGAGGAALSFCDPAERGYLRDIERLIRMRLAVVGEEPARVAGGQGAQESRGQGGKPGGAGRPNGRFRGGAGKGRPRARPGDTPNGNPAGKTEAKPGNKPKVKAKRSSAGGATARDAQAPRRRRRAA
ncbi:MAG: DEAD/DEAH box helicase [Kiloniellales bacterium]|nr:DEAD/DEAH box helicase [Kiloniellales bacterium]